MTPARPDLAADHLEGTVSARRFVTGVARQVTTVRAPLTARPDHASPLSTELLLGETFTVYDDDGAWSWGQADADGYVGYVPTAMLRADPMLPTHRVSALSTHIYPEPDLKSRPLAAVYMGSLVAAVAAEVQNGFVPLITGGWIFGYHLVAMGEAWGEPLGIAKAFLGAPYLWGGRTAVGIDCSGLVQAALLAAGLSCPRDTDMQADDLRARLPADSAPEAGDLVYFPGHVGFMVDGTNLLHANATHMAVTIDPLADVIAIVKRDTTKPPVTCVVRLATT